jgi:hypothetical protein
VIRVLKVTPDRLALKVIRVFKVLLDLRARLVQLEQREIKARLVLKVLP